MNTYTVAAARDDFSKILNLVATTGNYVSVVRYGKPIAKIVPAEIGIEPKKDWKAIAAKYAGMWSGLGYEWAAKIGRPSRYFRKRDYWS